MLTLEFDTTTTSEDSLSFPPTKFLNKDLKNCFYDASIIFTKHQEAFPDWWRYSEASIGSAYLNVVYLLYCNMLTRHRAVASKDMHKGSRFLYGVAKDYYQAEMNVLSEHIVFERFDVFPRFTWGYSTTGFQMLRCYGLVDYSNSVALWKPLLDFCEEAGIELAPPGDSVELRIDKVLSINVENKNTTVDIPDSVEPEILESSVSLMEKVLLSSGYEVSSLKLKDRVKILKNSQSCGVDSLTPRELMNITNQLKESPELLTGLLSLGLKSFEST